MDPRPTPHIERITLPIPGLHPSLEGLRIAQITDLHTGPTVKHRYIEDVVRATNDLKPDLIAHTGDLVDGSVRHLTDEVAPIADLSAPLGHFFVTGNHEYYSGVEAWIEHVDRLGATVLLNAHRVIDVRGARLLIAGVADYSAGLHDGARRSDPAGAMENAPDADFRLLMAHQPKSVFAASELPFDLQLSGHTHGGQFWPWRPLVALDQPYIDGLHRYRDLWVYVSRGTGYWGPPVRVGVPSEITLITLTGRLPNPGRAET